MQLRDPDARRLRHDVALLLVERNLDDTDDIDDIDDIDDTEATNLRGD